MAPCAPSLVEEVVPSFGSALLEPFSCSVSPRALQLVGRQANRQAASGAWSFRVEESGQRDDIHQGALGLSPERGAVPQPSAVALLCMTQQAVNVPQPVTGPGTHF